MPAPCLNPDLGAHRGPTARRRGARRVPRGLPVKVKHIVRWIKTPSRPPHLTTTIPPPVESSAVHFPIAQRYSADVLTFSTHQGVNQPAPSKFFPLSLPLFVSMSVCLSAPHSPFLSRLLKCLHSPIIFSVCVCVYRRQCGVLLQSRSPPSFSHSEGEFCTMCLRFSGSFQGK